MVGDIRYRHEGKLGEGYTEPLWTTVATSCQYIIILKQKKLRQKHYWKTLKKISKICFKIMLGWEKLQEWTGLGLKIERL